MKKYIPVTISLFLVLILHIQCVDKVKDLQLRQTVAAMNTQFPVVVDENTTVDSCSLQPNRVIRYHNSLIFDIPRQSIPFYTRFQKLTSQKNLFAGKENLKAMHDLGVAFEYAYNLGGKLLFLITLTPDEYYNEVKWGDDETAFFIIKDLVEALNEQYPIVYEEGDVVETEVFATYPRTINYVIQDDAFVKPVPFDTIAYKTDEMDFMIETTRNNDLNTVLDQAYITYRYIYYDKDMDYLFTLEYAPDDYRYQEIVQ